MPRKWTELIQAWPALQPERGHDVRITEVEKIAEPPGMKMVLEFADADQAGRTMTVVLPLPCRPGNPMSNLLMSTGVDVSVGTRFAPRDLVGHTVRAFFAAQPNGDVAVVRFEACPAGAAE